MKTLLIIASVILVPIAHRLLLGWLPYRWLVNSILHPYHIYKINQVFKHFTPKQKRDAGTAFVNKERWFKQYWFGRAADNYICKKFIEPYL